MAWIAGISRDQVNWGPRVDAEACVSCGMCMNCGKKVFDWVDGKPVVSRYNDCVVGCTTCGNLCLGQAITFPDFGELRKQYREHKVWSAVKKDLLEQGRISLKKEREMQ